jgi:superfamily II DNA or RNA helicase
VLQSIGRGLRKSDDEKATVLYDISDDLSIGERKNYSLLHSFERLKIYKKEEFDVKTFKVDI